MFNELESQQVWQIKNYGKDPRGKNEEGTQLGSDEWGTEWKYHGSKSIHCYQNQILSRNDNGNVSKEREKLTQGLTKLTTDKKRVIGVQVGQAPRYQE